MNTLLILRHGKSSWDDPSLDDHDRPLNRRGIRDAPRMGRVLREQSLVPDCILSSTALRARSTVEMVIEASGYEGKVELSRDLYHADPGTWVEMLRMVPEALHRVLIVGHNPTLEDLLELLTRQYEQMPTAALACVELPLDQWSQLRTDTRGNLLHIWRPREL